MNALYPEIAWRVISLSTDAGEERVAAIRRGIEETMEAMVGQVRELDPAAFDSPLLIWQVIITAALEGTIQR